MATQPSSARPLSASDKALHLRNLPAGATRVQVRDAKGKTAYRKPEDVVSTDTLMFGADGNLVVMRGEPGRKPKTQLEPLNDDAREVMAAKSDHLKDDLLVAAVETDPTADTVLDLIMQEMAKEASSLEFERKEAERHNSETSGLSVKRARILGQVGDMYLKRREKLAEGGLDLDSPQAQAFILHLLNTVQEVMIESGVRSEHAETIFGKLGKRLDEGWKQDAKSKMREAKK